MKYVHKFATVSEYNQAQAAVPNSDPWISYLEPNGLLTYSSAVNIQKAANGYEYVDLGLPSGLLWATCNVGANTPEQSGGYFAWGETATKSGDHSWETYVYGLESNPTKYNFTDNKTILDLSDDAASVNLGGDWRMPTKEEMQELIAETQSSQETVNGISGKRFTGQNNNSIFIPETGNYWGSNFSSGGLMLWTSSRDSSKGNAMFLVAGSIVLNRDRRCYGHPVRGVLSPSRHWHNPLLL